MKQCTKCRKRLPSASFCVKNASKDGLSPTCRLCHRKHVADWLKGRTAERKQWMNEYLKAHPCVDCGNADPRVLEFDHVRGKKKFGIGTKYIYRKMSEVLKEIAKCEVRCANCHRIKGFERNTNWKR